MITHALKGRIRTATKTIHLSGESRPLDDLLSECAALEGDGVVLVSGRVRCPCGGSVPLSGRAWSLADFLEGAARWAAKHAECETGKGNGHE